ncbi:hypothetical protein [Zooshikella ganghwensis]|uniref:hypothetical protein n=1 Tax=Zooshikella ganghwensis TaxID=202772 RepID=UPI000486CB3E|nr:hypothetical protein [Zooshikella ganghwensis]
MSSVVVKGKQYAEGVLLEQTELVCDYLLAGKDKYTNIVQWWAITPSLGEKLGKRKHDSFVLFSSYYGSWLGLYDNNNTIDEVVMDALST